MRFGFLADMGLGIVILLIGNNPLALAQSNISNQTRGQLNLSDVLGQRIYPCLMQILYPICLT